MKTNNPYKRIKEIDAILEPLELREKEFNKQSFKRKPQELEKIENEIFFLVIEKKHIEDTIKWFEKQNRNQKVRRKELENGDKKTN